MLCLPTCQTFGQPPCLSFLLCLAQGSSLIVGSILSWRVPYLGWYMGTGTERSSTPHPPPRSHGGFLIPEHSCCASPGPRPGPGMSKPQPSTWAKQERGHVNSQWESCNTPRALASAPVSGNVPVLSKEAGMPLGFLCPHPFTFIFSGHCASPRFQDPVTVTDRTQLRDSLLPGNPPGAAAPSDPCPSLPRA